MGRTLLLIPIMLFLASPITILASGEGTRHITGPGKDIYFMDDKVFGTIYGNPLWAIYHCGSEIKGQIDIKGAYHHFDFRYKQLPDRVITGDFGTLKMALENIR